MKKSLKFLLVAFVVTLVGLSACQMMEETKQLEIQKSDAMHELELNLLRVSNEATGGCLLEPSTRGFWSDLWNGIKKIGKFVCDDASGFVDGMINNDHEWYQNDFWRDAAHSAVDASFDALSAETRSTNVSTNLSPISNMHITEYQKRLATELNNPYNVYGIVHNEAFVKLASIAKGNESLTFEEMRHHLHVETAAALDRHNIASDILVRDDAYIENIINWRKKWKHNDGNYGTLYRQIYNQYHPDFTHSMIPANSTESEIRIMLQYVRSLSEIKDDNAIIEYANEFTSLVLKSSISDEKKISLLVFNSIATHSHGLWREVIKE